MYITYNTGIIVTDTTDIWITDVRIHIHPDFKIFDYSVSSSNYINVIEKRHIIVKLIYYTIYY